MGTLKSDSDAVVSPLPGGGHPHLAIVPHPANVVPQGEVLCDLVEAGGNWHVHHLSSLWVNECKGLLTSQLALNLVNMWCWGLRGIGS